MSAYKVSPADPIFQADRPYRLILRNSGERTHPFVSEGFFKAIATRRPVSPIGTVSTPALETVEIAPGEEKQLYFVPVTRGSYALACSVFLHEPAPTTIATRSFKRSPMTSSLDARTTGHHP